MQAYALQCGWGRSLVLAAGVPRASVGALAVDGSHHDSTDHKPIFKIGFGPAEAQILKPRMISAKDSQKEGQP